jgi:hypothetical protein
MYPDPKAPKVQDDGLAVTAQSNAELQMKRRTDAGPKEAATGPFGNSSNALTWGVVAAALLVVVAIFIALT